MNLDDHAIKWVLLSEAIRPKNGICMVRIDHYWIYSREKDAIAFYRIGRGKSVPQCNSNEEITRGIRDRLYPEAEVLKVGIIFERIDPHDYC